MLFRSFVFTLVRSMIHAEFMEDDGSLTMRVLVACEYSGRVRDAFLRKGHEAMSVDLLPTEQEGPHYQGGGRGGYR